MALFGNSLSGDSQVYNYTQPETNTYKSLTPIAAPEFSTPYQIGTADYSKALSGYLNNLSPEQLLGLGADFDISGLARSDLSTLNADLSGYSPEDIVAMSKYRNISRDGKFGPITGSVYGNGQIYQYTSPDSADSADARAREEYNLWGTRNFPGSSDYLYQYDANGNFVPVAPNEYGTGNFINDTLAPIAAAAVLGMAGGAIGNAALGALGSGAGATSAINPANFSLASGTATGGAGSSASLLTGAGSLTGTSGSLAGIAPSLASAGVSFAPSMAGMGANALLGSSSLGISPAFSLMDGAYSLNLGIADGSRYALPEELQSLDYSNPWKDLAQKVVKEGLNQMTSEPQGYSQFQGQQAIGFDSSNALNSYTPLGTASPYMFQMENLPQVSGYYDSLRSQQW